MKSDWRDEVKALATNACAVLQEHHGLGDVRGELHERCAKIWEFHSQARGEPARPAQALAEFAYARALDALPLTELAPTLRGDGDQVLGSLSTLFEAVERFTQVVGEVAKVRAAGQEAAALAQGLRIHAQEARDSEERTRLNKAAEVWARGASRMVDLYSLCIELPVVGCLLPPVRLKMAPTPLLGLQERERKRVLNRDFCCLERAGVPEPQLAQVWYGEDTAQNRKRVRQKLRDVVDAEEK